MKWVKPKFEIVELCSEVTSYLFHAVGDLRAGPVRVRVLGSAAGGGFPQWNCRCGTCEAARAGVRARPRTQSSLAIRGGDGPWLLVNASPDLRQQLETLDARGVDGVRAPPVAGVLLTDAEIDHTAGLLLLRESATPLRVFGAAGVERALTDGYPVLPMLERFCGVDWHTLEPGARSRSTARAWSSSRSRAATRRASGRRVEASGSCSATRDRRRRHLRPGLAGSTTTCSPASPPATSCSWTARSGATTSSRGWASRTAARTTWATCRSRARRDASRRWPRCERPRTVLVHINNTNPILLEDSPEREQVVRAGVEVAYDGLEVEL